MATMVKGIKIPKFDGEDYGYWSIRMKTFLMEKDLWSIVESNYKEPLTWSILGKNENRLKKEEQLPNCLALMDLKNYIEKGIFTLIASFGTTASAWRRMHDAYGCDKDTHGDCLIKEEPCCGLDHHFGESYEDSCSCYGQPWSFYGEAYMFE